MIDGIIKADGTSRLMKSELPATYEEFRAQCLAGTQPLDVLFNALGWSQMPTFLNKANLLKDPTAALFGFGNEAVPNTIFDWLGQYNTHWWSVLHGNAYSYYRAKQTKVAALTTIVGSYVTVQYAKSITVNADTGAISLDNPTSLTCGNSLNGVTTFLQTLCAEAPVYLLSTGDDETQNVFYIPAGATYTDSAWGDAAYTFSGWYNSSTGVKYVRVCSAAPDEVKASLVGAERVDVPAGATTYEHSADRNAYPDSGTVDGLTYQYLGVPFQNAVTAPKIATGNYTGTGNVGESNKNSLTFDFVPKLVVIRTYADNANNSIPTEMFVWLHGMYAMPVYFADASGSSNLNVFCELNGNTLSWYCPQSGDYQRRTQFNVGGKTYYWVAIG